MCLRSVRDLLAHLPTAAPSPLVLHRERAGSKTPSPERLGARSPVTVTSSFEDKWAFTRKAIETTDGNGAGASGSNDVGPAGVGHSGAGLSRKGSLGAKVDVKELKGRRRRGVGPGVT